jgi:hypothetical protein
MTLDFEAETGSCRHPPFPGRSALPAGSLQVEPLSGGFVHIGSKISGWAQSSYHAHLMISHDQTNAMDPSKRKRARRPKVRTGCGTCKTRHLKCDERKPTCLRCEKSHMKCLGYVDPSQKPAQVKVPEIRRILPRPIRPSSSAPGSSDLPAATLELAPSIPAPMPGQFIGQHAIYFDFFRRQLSRDLEHLSKNSEFWIRNILSQSMLNDCVRNSVLALGALSQAIHVENSLLEQLPGKPTVSLPLSKQFFLNEHHEAATSFQVQAVSLFRQFFMTAEPRAQPSTVLVVFLLFIAFELLQGNMPAADSLIRSGILSLRDYISVYRRSSKGLPGAPRLPLDDNMEEIEIILPRLAVMGSYSPFCVSPYSNSSLLIPNSCEPEDLPPLWQASNDELKTIWNSFLTRIMGFISRAVGYKLHNLPYDIAATTRTQMEFLKSICQWRAFFHDFCDDLDLIADTDMREYFRMADLHLTFCRVFLECCLDASELSYDVFEPVFREILTQCDFFISKCSTKDNGDRPEPMEHAIAVRLVPPLVFVAAKCRVHKIRMAAIRMLRRVPSREGWDLRTIIAGQLAQIELEERGAVDKDHIPASSRYVWSASTWDDERGKLRAFFTRAIPTEEGTPYRVEMDLDV